MRKLLCLSLMAAVLVCAPSCGLFKHIVFEGDPLNPAQTSGEAKPGEPSKPDVGKKEGAATDKDAVCESSSNIDVSEVQAIIIAAAKAQLGKKYKYGATGPDTYDCSGLMYCAFKEGGITLPRNSGAQYSFGKKIAKGEQLKPCDLVFFSGSKVSSTVGHVGMVLTYDESTDTFTFIHASSSNGVEIQKSTTDYYVKRYIGVCRVL